MSQKPVKIDADVVERLQQFRAETGIPITVLIKKGMNLYLDQLEAEREMVREFATKAK